MLYFRILCAALLVTASVAVSREQWTVEQARTWEKTVPWLVGCNFSPSSAINQLEMWQADSFDPATIDRELGWAEQIGFTSVRVFLHNLLWDQDKDGLLKRMDQFLAMAEKHKIGVMFVPLDSCWDPAPKLGKQRDPKPHVHNSGWVQAPGLDLLKDTARHDELKPYIVGVISHFKNDKRIHAWDLFNEPDNRNTSSYVKQEPPNKAELALALLKKTFAWAREADPAQPITTGVWLGNWGDVAKLSQMEKYQLDQSDVISFHNYSKLDDLKKCVENLKRYNRPILCTEYMARPAGSTFEPHLAYMKEQRVGAYNWGFVDGKTNTIYPWDSWARKYDGEPPLWFHDIFRRDGTAYKKEEVEYIKKVTGK